MSFSRNEEILLFNQNNTNSHVNNKNIKLLLRYFLYNYEENIRAEAIKINCMQCNYLQDISF